MRHIVTFTSDLLGPQGASLFSWSPSGDILAAAGARKKKVVLFDRGGTVLAHFTVPDPEFLYDEAAEPPVLQLSWHPSGSHLAILPRGQPFAMVWAATKDIARVDSGIKPAEVTALAWNPDRPQLALGTVKGCGVIFDCTARHSTPLSLGRSAKPVCCMAWSNSATTGGLLALGCKGGLLLLCRAADGGLERSVQLKGALNQLQFCGWEAANAGKGGLQPCSTTGGPALLAANVGKRTLCIWQLPHALSPSASGPVELCFREGYGELEHFTWLHRGLLAAGFSSGQLVAVTAGGSLQNQAGEGAGVEVFSSPCLQHSVASLSWCPDSETLVAGAGRHLLSLSCRGQEVAADPGAGAQELPPTHTTSSLQLSLGGKLLTVCTAEGKLLQLRVKPPLLHGTYGSRLAYVDHASHPNQALLAEQQGEGQAPMALPLPAEPEVLALGPQHLAVAQTNKVWFQELEPDATTGTLRPPAENEYPAGPIRWMQLNSSCVLLLEEGGRVFVQSLGEGGPGDDIGELRGEGGEPFSASCTALTEHFILLGLPDGTLAFYNCSNKQLVSQYQHDAAGISCIFPNADGSMVLFQDCTGGTFLYNAVRGDLMQLPELCEDLQAAAWDATDPAVLAAVNSAGTVHVYCHITASLQGPGLKLVGTQVAPKGAALLTLHAGVLTWHLPVGHLEKQTLATHQHLVEEATGRSKPTSQSISSKGMNLAHTQPGNSGAISSSSGGATGLSREERLVGRCQQALALCHFDSALDAARCLGDKQLLREVALAALQFLEVPTALAAYEAAGEEEALRQLRPLAGIQGDDNLLMGHIMALTGGDPDRAEQLLLASSNSSAAIDMRKALGHWDRALELAQHLQPEAMASMALLRAEALEAEGQVDAALALFQQALDAPDLAAGSEAGAEQLRRECQAGVAMCSILLGNVEQGMQLAAASGSSDVLLECAELLEAEQHTKQAGQLYAHAEQFERAAQLFLSCREFALLDGVMEHAGSPEVWLQYAQAKEDLGSFADAARAYEQAGDVLAAVRVHLDRLNDAKSAAKLAQRMQSAEAALMVAKFCERAGDHKLAVELYCAGGDCTATFALAQRCGCIPAFADWARREGSAEAALLAAGDYEAKGQLTVAAELYAAAGKNEQAARLYIQAGKDSVPAAIRLAEAAQDPAVSAVVVEHLQAAEGMGATLQSLHLSLGNYEQACVVAVARAKQDQAVGNYKAARQQLLEVCSELQQRGAAATPALLSTLACLHSYLLVRTLVRQADHLSAARLLLRVADSIQDFPKHVVPILTSTVIECHRAELHGPAQRWASVLMKPEYRGQVSAAYAKKIEAIAKQPAWTADQGAQEPQCDCMFCGSPGPETSLGCTACHRALPFCAASGKRLTLSDCSECPVCRFPCRGRDLIRVAAVERCCQLCDAALDVHAVKRIFDPVAHMRRSVFAALLGGSASTT